MAEAVAVGLLDLGDLLEGGGNLREALLPGGLGEAGIDGIELLVLIVLGPAEELENVTAEDIRIVVDLTEFASNGTYSVKAQVFVDNHDQVGAIGGDYTVACKITS